MTTMEQVIEEMGAFCTRKGLILAFAPDVSVKIIDENSNATSWHTAAEIAAMVSEGEERRCHETLVETLEGVFNRSFKLTDYARGELKSVLDASKAALARERGA